ncbi:MAG: serine hydrolase [Bacteroidales bacterium]|nr:serine hydrolase [Bacteroidales bacterium]
MFEEASANKNLNCLIVFKDNQIVKEAFFNNYGSSTLHDVRSVTKSIMATLLGIAVDNGIISSENDTLGKFLYHYCSEIDIAKSGIKISNILTMSSGISGNELMYPNEYLNWFYSNNQIEYTLTKPMNSLPGEKFNYNSGTAHLLSGILTQATGNSVKDFAKEHLFKELDINIDKHYWQVDKQGLNNGGAGLQLTAYDMLKIGQLYLNKGVYQGKRIVSEDWVEKSTRKQISTDNAQPFGPYYGYFWWIGETHGYEYYFANGYGGQFLVIVPEIKLIVVATNKWLNIDTNTANKQWYSTLEMIIKKIISIY